MDYKRKVISRLYSVHAPMKEYMKNKRK